MKKYSNPELEIVNLEETDVIKTSLVLGDGDEFGEGGEGGEGGGVIEWT